MVSLNSKELAWMSDSDILERKETDLIDRIPHNNFWNGNHLILGRSNGWLEFIKLKTPLLVKRPSLLLKVKWHS
ncbi:13927_t:CDS:2 [Entrophospora sp. SA101]|nr:13927_t:CDS:2 [Entrophospora sp. SA101]